MLTKILPLAFISILTASISLFSYSGGNGTAGDPWQISTIADIEEMMNNSADWLAGNYFILTNDIRCVPYEWSGSNPSPIGDMTNQFTANFDGQGYTISDLTMYKPGSDYVGFFGICWGLVSNLELKNFNVTGNNSVGIMAGNSSMGSTFRYCSVSGTVTANSSAGGFSGSVSYFDTQYCSSTASVTTSNGYSGGFIGSGAEATSIRYCSSTGNVSNTSGDYSGGFCGLLRSGDIRYSFSSGDVSSSGDYVGGFCGRSTANSMDPGSDLHYCHSSGNASGDNNIGGFCGSLEDGPWGNSDIIGSYSTGTPTGNTNVGGFIGYESASSGTNTISCNYWGFSGASLDDIGNSGDRPAGEISELTPAQMTNPDNFTCFDFNSVWIMGSLFVGAKPAYPQMPMPSTPLLRSLVVNPVIPTLTEWSAIILISLLSGFGIWFIWKRFI